MAQAASRVAEGDLSVAVTPKSSEDALGTSFAAMIENLSSLVGDAQTSATQLAHAKAELGRAAEQAAQATQGVAQTTSQVAQGTSQQASSIQEVTLAVDQLAEATEGILRGARTQATSVEAAVTLGGRVSAAVEQMSDSAIEASAGAREATEAAQNGAAMVSRAVEGIARIKNTVEATSDEILRLGGRSQEIGKIVSVIDDIAAQTNLLALNAAIEAARAGEQGRGFAVVADEVRKLAERVATATKEIADLIGGVQAGVDRSVQVMQAGSSDMQAGSQQAAEAGEALQKILTAVERMDVQISQIASGSRDLKSSGAEMLSAIQEARKVVDRNLRL
jgi:methyl-accepting chemotaxis protein